MTPRKGSFLKALSLSVVIAAPVLVSSPSSATPGDGTPKRSAAHKNYSRAGAGLAWGPGLGVAPTVSARASAPLAEEISFGVLGGLSGPHATRAGHSRALHGALELEWRLDHGKLVPTLHVGAGGLLISTLGSNTSRPVLHLSAGADYWPASPFEGFSVGLEYRYLGGLSTSPTFILQHLAIRISWGW